MLCVLAMITFVLVAVSLWRLDPSILKETGVRIALLCLLIMGLVSGFFAKRNRSQRNVVLSADSLGIWAGIWGQRIAWSQIDKLKIGPPVGTFFSPQRHLVIHFHTENDSKLGQAIAQSIHGRAIDLRWVVSTQNDIVAGLTAAAGLAGVTLTEIATGRSRVWQVTPKAS